MGEWLERQGFRVLRFDSATKNRSHNVLVRLGRFFPMLRAALGLRKELIASPAVVYCSVSGGYAILGEILFALIACRQGAQLVLHHHSFRYLDRPFLPMQLLAQAAGSSAVHVVLG